MRLFVQAARQVCKLRSITYIQYCGFARKVYKPKMKLVDKVENKEPAKQLKHKVSKSKKEKVQEKWEEDEEEALEYEEYNENLVIRPPKGFLWGFSGQLTDKQGIST